MMHVTHTVHQAQKVFIINVHTDLVVLAVATLNELDFWDVPIPVHSIVSYLRPEPSRALPLIHALNWL